jgi:ABC-type bacteriocin/lantibiotic exporter with double-glycine peptidase domain
LTQYFISLTKMVEGVDKLLRHIPKIERSQLLLKEQAENDHSEKIKTMLKGKIEFQNVSFRYGTDGPHILKNINLTINPKEWVAIVGPSGAGKSTLIRLILGLEKCDEGTILLDDIPIEQLDMQTIRHYTATLLQNPQLLSGNIIDNLRASNPYLTENEMKTLLQRVSLLDEVMNMPMRQYTIIVGDGRSLSMGQRQRLVLARCLAKPFSLILLDEATSSLDNYSQEVILSTLKQMLVTRIIIAHRISTIQKADRVILMDKGTIVS